MKVAVSWSGGKDSAYALAQVRREHDVACLVTSVTRDHGRVSMHGVRTGLLDAQARALGLPVRPVELSARGGNAAYEEQWLAACEQLRKQGVEGVVFGDLFLEDVRAYREKLLARTGLAPLFPLWGRPTARLARAMLRDGVRAVLCCVDTQQLDARFAGCPWDEALLAELPAGVDPCGERGEFHTFVFDGPCFPSPVAWTRGEVVLRDGRFAFCDLLPG